jgi:hypothetical protein
MFWHILQLEDELGGMMQPPCLGMGLVVQQQGMWRMVLSNVKYLIYYYSIKLAQTK